MLINEPFIWNLIIDECKKLNIHISEKNENSVFQWVFTVDKWKIIHFCNPGFNYFVLWFIIHLYWTHWFISISVFCFGPLVHSCDECVLLAGGHTHTHSRMLWHSWTVSSFQQIEPDSPDFTFMPLWLSPLLSVERLDGECLAQSLYIWQAQLAVTVSVNFIKRRP